MLYCVSCIVFYCISLQNVAHCSIYYLLLNTAFNIYVLCTPVSKCSFSKYTPYKHLMLIEMHVWPLSIHFIHFHPLSSNLSPFIHFDPIASTGIHFHSCDYVAIWTTSNSLWYKRFCNPCLVFFAMDLISCHRLSLTDSSANWSGLPTVDASTWLCLLCCLPCCGTAGQHHHNSCPRQV